MFSMTKEKIVLISLIVVLISILYVMICRYCFYIINNPYVSKGFYVIITYLTISIAYFQFENNRKLAQNLSFQYMKRWMESPINEFKITVISKMTKKLDELKTRDEIKDYFSAKEINENQENFNLYIDTINCCNF